MHEGDLGISGAEFEYSAFRALIAFQVFSESSWPPSPKNADVLPKSFNQDLLGASRPKSHLTISLRDSSSRLGFP